VVRARGRGRRHVSDQQFRLEHLEIASGQPSHCAAERLSDSNCISQSQAIKASGCGPTLNSFGIAEGSGLPGRSFLQLLLRGRINRDDSTCERFERRGRETVLHHQLTHCIATWKFLDRIAKIIVGIFLAC